MIAAGNEFWGEGGQISKLLQYHLRAARQVLASTDDDVNRATYPGEIVFKASLPEFKAMPTYLLDSSKHI